METAARGPGSLRIMKGLAVGDPADRLAAASPGRRTEARRAGSSLGVAHTGVFHASASCWTPHDHPFPVFLSPRLIGRGWDREVGPRWELKMPQALRVYPLVLPLGVRRVLGSTAEAHTRRCGPASAP